MNFRAVLFCLILLSLLLGACQPAASPATATPEPPGSILFIGNSFTYYNLGVDAHMGELIASTNPSPTIDTSSVTSGNATLEQLWEYSEARDTIGEGSWDVVVLQEYPQVVAESGGQEFEKFYEYARKFDEEIKQVGAETVLYMTWEYAPRQNPLTIEEIAEAHSHIGSELGVKVAPAGLAFQRSIQERPDLDLYDSDGVHPNARGTYLAICVLYATIYGKSPVGLSYQPADMIAGIDAMKQKWEEWQMSDDEVAFLQRIAWETVIDYQAEL